MNISSNKMELRERRQDKGCGLSPCCLDCPFPSCAQEEPDGGKSWFKARRDASIADLRRNSGISTEELGRQFRVSRRTVYRAIEKSKKLKIKNKKWKGKILEDSEFGSEESGA